MPIPTTDPLGPTIDDLLDERAASHGGNVFLRFAAGETTFAEAADRVRSVASGLAGLGIAAGDAVPVAMGNRAEFVITCFALCRLGAVPILVNTALRGPALEHAVGLAAARIMIAEAALVAGLPWTTPAMTGVAKLVVVDPLGVEPPAGVSVTPFGLLGGAEVPLVRRRADEPAVVVFTSGTTGPSKGCVLPHRYLVRQAELMVEHLRLSSDDVLYCPYPLFHIDALVLTVMPALVLGTTAAIGERFSTSGFWPEVRRFGATVFDFMGATLTMLHRRPPAPDDIDNPVRLAWGVPIPEFAGEFEQRFGLRLVELYGSTDAGVPIYEPLDEPRRPGSCGRVIDAYAIDVVDDCGLPLAAGEVGELVVRPQEPALMSSGYHGMPEATLVSRRDLWFHTGDLVRRDADGFVYFVGRLSDSIRRRGENISAFEVEEVVKLHPDVFDAAAYGVPSELTEDEVMVAVVARPGATIEPGDLALFCRERLARHMVPRFIEVVGDLPRTPTEKVRKDLLRTRGVTPVTWDAERPAE